jgi:uncharacterized protein (TIGR02646 family)
MMKLNRPTIPTFLAENWESWGQDYAEKKTQNPAYKFVWKQHNLQKVNHLLLPLLKNEMQKDHCVYCDGFPVSTLSDKTIEHFLPKGNIAYYHLVYQWENLFYCCRRCQKIKGENFNELLLKPDEFDYEFSTYFIINFNNGKIGINPNASPTQQERAKYTKDFLNLNDIVICNARMNELRNFVYVPDNQVDDYSYRYLFL